MLTLLLVLGAVTCSPVPSDSPPAPPDAAHIEVTHEVRHVTYEVSEEVNEATASSHIPSDVPPEEDPPIPTVTTPHTAPEEQQSQDEATEGHAVVPVHLEEQSAEISQETLEEQEVQEDESHPQKTESEEKESEVKLDLSDEVSTEVRVSETDGASKSDMSQDVTEESSSEGLSLVPESHIFESEDEAHASHQEETSESEEEAGVSAITPSSGEVVVSAVPTEVVDSALDAPEHPEEVVSEKSEEDASPVETEPAGEIITQVDSQEHSDIIAQVDEPLNNEDHNSNGEFVEVVPSQDGQEADSTFLETIKRTDAEDLPIYEDIDQDQVSESSGDSASEESASETTRESRVYHDYGDDEIDRSDKVAVPEEFKSHSDQESHDSGLESLSMTSPTPEANSEDVPIVDDLEKEEAPPAEDQGEETATSIPEIDLQEENSTLTTNVQKQPDIVPEVVINPPSSSIAPLPVEEFTDNYSDPLEPGNLPDFDVTHEQLPSEDYPLPEEAELIPEHAHDHTGEVSDGESSDLAAEDHVLEVEAGTPRVLPPQQEQVSAAAPSSLTPGCIVAIVFGVLLSLVIILGVGGFIVWQRRTQNRPKVLGNDQGYAGSDSGGYIDDQVRVSYVNSQTDTPKESPEDLISLDNDSFLNSLESMTIQNLWTDNIRHTKL